MLYWVAHSRGHSIYRWHQWDVGWASSWCRPTVNQYLPSVNQCLTWHLNNHQKGNLDWLSTKSCSGTWPHVVQPTEDLRVVLRSFDGVYSMNKTLHYFVGTHFHDINSRQGDARPTIHKVLRIALSTVTNWWLTVDYCPSNSQPTGQHSTSSVGTKLTDGLPTLDWHLVKSQLVVDRNQTTQFD